jgi:F-type H+-transporting ATPase subunit epsilon
MKLRVLIPTHVAVDEEVDKINAQAVDGAFCLMPRHVDFVAALVPGLLSYHVGDSETFLAVNGGTLVKCGDEVLVSTPDAVPGRELAELRRAVKESFAFKGEHEQRARAALQKIEADLIRRFVELEEYG